VGLSAQRVSYYCMCIPDELGMTHKPSKLLSKAKAPVGCGNADTLLSQQFKRVELTRTLSRERPLSDRVVDDGPQRCCILSKQTSTR